MHKERKVKIKDRIQNTIRPAGGTEKDNADKKPTQVTSPNRSVGSVLFWQEENKKGRTVRENCV